MLILTKDFKTADGDFFPEGDFVKLKDETVTSYWSIEDVYGVLARIDKNF